MNNEHILCRAFNNMKRTSDFLLHRGAQSTAIGQFGLQLNIIAARYRFKYYQDFNQLLIPCESFDSSASSFNIYVDVSVISQINKVNWTKTLKRIFQIYSYISVGVFVT